ncbi:hypothetical protein ACIOMM_36445 [Streptomyces sp. NPDC087908]|uniref:hypothetical protein n=1 Tax=Streptomyces sp. NPDC087908 TaxID=3365820 RepID=UPI00382D6E24
MIGLDWTESSANRTPVLRTIDRAFVDCLPKDPSSFLYSRLNLNQTEPGLWRQVDGLANDGPEPDR